MKNPAQEYLIEKKAFACDLSKVPSSTYQDVYEPSEDSFLLIDGIHFDLQTQYKKKGKIERVIEVG